MADNDRNKGSIYVDGNERHNIVSYRNWFCDIWFNKLPRMFYFEGVYMKRVKPGLKSGET